MDVSTVGCNQCKRQKQEVNHWLIAITMPGMEGILFLPAEAVELPKLEGFVYEDICGQACAHKRLSQYLDDLKTPSPITLESEAV